MGWFLAIDVKKERELMELAIDAMKGTVYEPRKDKIPPYVGASLLMPDGTIETACRGEYRDGDHAEYTLIERKKHKVKLDGSILFTTLEPCAPGSRDESKFSCADRIIKARIKEVYVGIEDPDPLVSHKGIIHLQNNGVIIHMFPQDLQKIIREVNKDFLEHALKRKEDAIANKQKPEDNSIEWPNEKISIQDLSKEALELYRVKLNIPESIDSSEFEHRLSIQNLLKEKDGKLRPTGFCILLFGNQPRNIINESGLLGTIRYPDGSEEIRDFNYPLVLIPTLVEEWLKSKLPTIHDRSQMISKELLYNFPFNAIREAIVNALIHRDYNITGAKCQLIVTEQTITIISPGAPRNPITVEQMQAFNAPMLSRNPMLHYVLAQIGSAEERGFGLDSLKTAAETYQLPLPKYTFKDPYLELTIYTSKESAIDALSTEVRKALNKDEIRGWQFISSKTTIISSEYASYTGFNYQKSVRHLNKFLTLKLIRRIGGGRSTKYEIVR